ncbi:MAG TPA: type IV secretory system conjugative DNA transfer family protein, partial [Chitinivibrionales bacterium]|nr:type IV secretory system conjugative DNA transfer family protein [Chitinivibrionales bacterium]
MILAVAWWYYDNNGRTVTGGGGAIFVLFMAGFALLVWIFRDMESAPKAPEAPYEEPVSGNFGTASFMSPNGGMWRDEQDASDGIFFGKYASPDYPYDDGGPVFSRPENHVIIFAKTRAGKGTRVICPTLLRYGLGNIGRSCIVIDPKGELSAISGRTRAQKQHVHVINPWGELESTYAALGLQSATFNPLDVLDRHDRNAVAVAQALATAICPQEKGGKDGFWTENASSLLTAVLLWLADQSDNETKTLARAREIVSLPRKELKEKFLIPMCDSDAFEGAIRENAATFIDMAPETYSGVISNLGRFTKFLSDPQIKAATSSSSFSMTDLTGAGKDRPTTLYIVIPPDRVETQRTWLRLMITAGMQTFRRKPPGAKYRCLFLIDEFAALGKLDISIATMSGYGIDYALILQNMAQLREIYGDASNDIVSNCAYKWFCNINDPSTAEYLNKTLGKKTVRTKNKG